MKSHLLNKIITLIFDITFTNFHFKKNYSVEEAKKTAYINTSTLVTFLLFVLFINLSIILIILLRLEFTRFHFYFIFLPIALLFFLKKNLIKEHIVKPNINFSIEKYSEEFIKGNKKRNLFLILIFGLTGGLSYVVMRLLIIFIHSH